MKVPAGFRPQQMFRRHPRWAAPAAVAAFLLVALTTLLLLGAIGESGVPATPEVSPSPTTRPPTRTPVPTRTPTPTATPSPTPEPTATPTQPPPAAAASGPSAPVHVPLVGVAALRIPRFGVDAAAEWIGLLWNNQMDTPHNPLNVGWYSIYDEPGQGGNGVFSAHVDYYPNIRGPFYDLDQMVGGDQVVVILGDGTELTYEVFSNRRYDATKIPMGEVIWPSNRPGSEEWITLITCGGTFQPNNGTSGPGHYLHRDVVVARLVD